MLLDHRGIPQREPAPNQTTTHKSRANQATDNRKRLYKASRPKDPLETGSKTTVGIPDIVLPITLTLVQ